MDVVLDNSKGVISSSHQQRVLFSETRLFLYFTAVSVEMKHNSHVSAVDYVESLNVIRFQEIKALVSSEGLI